MSEPKAYLDCGSDLVCGLVDVLNLALVDKFPTPRINLDDLEHLFDTVRLLGPKVPGMEVFEGLLYIVRRDLLTATQIFRSLVERGLCLPNSRALLIYCMNANGDTDWLIEATQVLENETADTVLKLVQAIMANEDLKRAAEDAKASGHFDIPDSVRSIMADRERLETLRTEAAQRLPDEMVRMISEKLDPSFTANGHYLRL